MLFEERGPVGAVDVSETPVAQNLLRGGSLLGVVGNHLQNEQLQVWRVRRFVEERAIDAVLRDVVCTFGGDAAQRAHQVRADSDSPDVGGRPNLEVFVLKHLGGHVVFGAHEIIEFEGRGFFEEMRDPKISELELALLRQENVVGLHVEVDPPLLVEVDEGGSHVEDHYFDEEFGEEFAPVLHLLPRVLLLAVSDLAAERPVVTQLQYNGHSFLIRMPERFFLLDDVGVLELVEGCVFEGGGGVFGRL